MTDLSDAPAPGLAAQEVERREAAAFAIWISNGGIERLWTERAIAREGYPFHEQVQACYRQADAVLAALSAPRPAQTKGPTE